MPLKLLRLNRKQDVENVKINPHNGTQHFTHTHTLIHALKIPDKRGLFNCRYYWGISHRESNLEMCWGGDAQSEVMNGLINASDEKAVDGG